MENGQGVKISWKSWKLRVGLAVGVFLLLAGYVLFFAPCENMHYVAIAKGDNPVISRCSYGLFEKEWYYDGQEDVYINLFDRRYTLHEQQKSR